MVCIWTNSSTRIFAQRGRSAFLTSAARHFLNFSTTEYTTAARRRQWIVSKKSSSADAGVVANAVTAIPAEFG